MQRAEFNNWLADPHRRCLLMGVLNVTPDSFSDGGDFLDPRSAIDHAKRMAHDGASIIDIGGESTRPGADPVPPDEQIRRIVPVIEAIRPSIDVPISVDTTRSAVAAAALDAGADLVNDISAGTSDPALLPLVASRRVPVVLMHMLGNPKTMQQDPHYEDVVAEVCDHLRSRVAAACAAGVTRERILVDPGIGFGKTLEHNLALLRHLPELAALGQPVLVGTSRKRFIGALTGESDPRRRLFGTAATLAWSVANGASVLRVHDVREMKQVVDVVEGVRNARKREGA